MIKKLLIIFLVSTVILSAEGWQKSIDMNLTINQNAYSNNWTGTEVGLVAWVINVNGLVSKQLLPKINNRNMIKLAFGQTINQIREDSISRWSSPVKSTDLIDFESLLRFTLGILVDPFIAARVESQFLDMSDITQYRVFNPLKFTESFGIARTLIKKDKTEWNTRCGAGFRQHYNRIIRNTTNDGGLEFITDFKIPLVEQRITYTSNLQLFQAIFRSGTPPNNNWKAVDMNWENIFTATITKYLMVSLYTQLLYDKENTSDLRIKETLALGLTYKLS